MNKDIRFSHKLKTNFDFCYDNCFRNLELHPNAPPTSIRTYVIFIEHGYSRSMINFFGEFLIFLLIMFTHVSSSLIILSNFICV